MIVYFVAGSGKRYLITLLAAVSVSAVFQAGPAQAEPTRQWCDPLVSALMLATCECKHPFPDERGWTVAKDECVFVKKGDCAGTAQYQDISGPIPTPRDTVGCELSGTACVPKASAFTGPNIRIAFNNCHIAAADECTGTCQWEKPDPPVRFVSDSGCEFKKGADDRLACLP